MSNGSGKRKNNQPIITILVSIVLIVMVVISRTGRDDTENKTEELKAGEGNLIVHFLDVGQGDSEFIELPDGSCMLIDASEREYGDDVVEDIRDYGYSRIDYLVATHPHSDHIGGMVEVIKSLDIGEIYMPKASSNSKSFEKMLNAISDKGLKINTAKSGVTIYSDSELEIKILAPVSSEYDDLNNYSAVVKVTYGKNSFLFTGDAEAMVEKELINSDYSALDADVLKVGHHGSSSSSTMDFLNAVSPDYCVISCGEDNSYGHPHKETVSRLAKIGAQVYRTDIEGTVTIYCDGNGGIGVITEE